MSLNGEINAVQLRELIAAGEKLSMVVGTCGSNTDRTRIHPGFAAAGFPVYNPQVPDWDPAVHPLAEKLAKEHGHYLPWIIGREARSLVSLFEVVSIILQGRNTAGHIDFVRAGEEVEGQVITEIEAIHLNSAREFVVKLARAFDVPVYQKAEHLGDPHLIAKRMAEPACWPRTTVEIEERVTQAGLIPSYKIDDTVIPLGINPLDTLPLLQAFVLAAATERQVRFVVPTKDQLAVLEGTTWFDGIDFTGRRWKDVVRFFDPYLVDVAREMNVLIVEGSPNGRLLPGSGE